MPQSKKVRQRKEPKYKSFKLTKKIKPAKPIVSPLWLIRSSWKIIFSNKKIFFSLVLIGAIAGFILTQGFGASINFSNLKQTTMELLGQDKQTLGSGVILLSELVNSSSANSTQALGVYQSLLWLIISLATIWSVRTLKAKEEVSIKEAFYKGSYPAITFVLVFFVIGLQMIPLAMGNFLFSVVITGGLAVTVIEKVLWLFLIILLAVLSLYMVLSSLFALYIVTLPEMTPLKALRSARGLVVNRRFAVFIRLLAMFFMILIIFSIVMLPFIFFVPAMVEFIFYLVSSFCLVYAHVYIYSLYRELL